MSTFTDALTAGPIVLDGGLGTLLESRGHDLSLVALVGAAADRRPRADPSGARRVLRRRCPRRDHLVVPSELHRTGCRGSRPRRRRRRCSPAAWRSPRRARDDAGLSAAEAWIAASVGPYGASRADGSEYTGDYGLWASRSCASGIVRDCDALAAAGPDAIAVETIPSLAELEALCRELDGLGIPAWVSVTIADGAAAVRRVARGGVRARRGRCPRWSRWA